MDDMDKMDKMDKLDEKKMQEVDTDTVVTVAHFSEPIEAEMAKGRLESAGIEVFLSGENARILEPGLGPLGLQVAGKDAADAQAILADAGEELAEANAGVVIHPNELP